jgi:Co/Zn/Cd efflux system component
MSRSLGWMTTLDTVSMVLTLLVLLVGLIMTIVAFFKKGKSRVALLGAIGFLLMLLLSCCGIAWRIADRPIYDQPPKTAQTLIIVRAVSLFLLNLLQLVGLILIIVAVWMGGKKDETP